MAIQKRTLIRDLRVLPNGNIEVAQYDEFYDDEITPQEQVGLPNDENYQPAVTDVISRGGIHRSVIAKNEPIPQVVQAVLNNTKAE